MDMEFEDIPSSKIAYIRRIGSYGQENVLIMEELKKWAGSRDLLNEKSVILGIAHDNPEAVKPENCRYDTCIIISEDCCIDGDNVSEGSIPGGKYAVFKIGHTAEKVQKAWQSIFPELFRQGLKSDETRPVMERYRAEMVKENYCEICVPID